MTNSAFAKKLVWIGSTPLLSVPLLRHNCCQPSAGTSGALVWEDDRCSWGGSKKWDQIRVQTDEGKRIGNAGSRDRGAGCVGTNGWWNSSYWRLLVWAEISSQEPPGLQTEWMGKAGAQPGVISWCISKDSCLHNLWRFPLWTKKLIF